MILRRFSDEGLDAAREVLGALRTGELEGVPDDLLSHPDRTVEVGVRLPATRTFDVVSRWELGIRLYQVLEGPSIDRSLLVTPGLWTWLAFWLFDVICPREPGGKRRWQADDSRYVFRRGDFRKHYRHLLAGPYFLVRAHIDSGTLVQPVLSNPPYRPGELYEQLASRKPIFLSQGAMNIARRLYWDAGKGKLRRGAGGSGARSPRRLCSGSDAA